MITGEFSATDEIRLIAESSAAPVRAGIRLPNTDTIFETDNNIVVFFEFG
jgi:hypothetical protein